MGALDTMRESMEGDFRRLKMVENKYEEAQREIEYLR